MNKIKLHPAKLKLLIFAFILVGIRSGLLIRDYITSIYQDGRGEVLGVTAQAQSFESISLPDYPILIQPAPAFAARSYALYDVNSNQFLIEQEANKPLPLASTTKIMTSLLTLENTDLDTVHTVDKLSTYSIGSTVLLQPAEKITLRDLLYTALLNSGNDAAFALANQVGAQQLGSDGIANTDWEEAIQRFVDLMNKKADNLGLDSFSFKDPAGLDDDNIGSARDLAKLAAIALENETFSTIVATKELSVTSTDGVVIHQLKNSNRLVSEWNYPGAIGVKTGFTPAAGHNLVAAVQRDGHLLIAVVFNTYDNSVTASAQVARDIFDFAARAVEWK